MKYALPWLLSLLFSVIAQAQNPAPIAWGDSRWLGIWHYGEADRVALMGDTLVFAADSIFMGQGYTPIVCYSHDNGLTFSPWQRLDSQIWLGARVRVCGSAGRLYALCWRQVDGDPVITSGWILRSLDGGRTWAEIVPPTVNVYSTAGLATGSDFLHLQTHRVNNPNILHQAVLSHDGGDSWQPPVSYSPSRTALTLAVTRSHTLLLLDEWISYWPNPAVFVSDRSCQNWSPLQLVSEHLLVPTALSIAADTSSETAIVLGVLDTVVEPLGDLHIIRTTDGGTSWEPARALTDWGPIWWGWAKPGIFCRGALWGVLWENTNDPDHSRWGAYVSFSANHGKDWYPPSPIGIDVPEMYYSGGQFVGNEVRVYWVAQNHEVNRGDWMQATGLLTPDTLPPSLSLSLLLADTLRAGDTLRVAATALDDDTLSAVRLLWSDSAGMRPPVVLEAVGDGVYLGSVVVPHAGRFHYRGEAEDFWEHVTADPDSDWLSFMADEVSSLGGAAAAVPKAFTVDVYPNPFNSTTQIRYSLPQAGRVSLRIFDLLGRELRVLVDERVVVGEHAVAFDAADLPSGLYIARLEAAGQTHTRKLVLLK